MTARLHAEVKSFGFSSILALCVESIYRRVC